MKKFLQYSKAHSLYVFFNTIGILLFYILSLGFIQVDKIAALFFFGISSYLLLAMTWDVVKFRSTQPLKLSKPVGYFLMYSTNLFEFMKKPLIICLSMFISFWLLLNFGAYGLVFIIVTFLTITYEKWKW